jgi:hypothetical protein
MAIPFETYSAPLGIALAVQFVLFVRWVYRRIRNDELLRIFVRDMATNHLPHVYHALRELCQKQGIDLADPPPIRWIDMNGKNGNS